MVRIFSTLDMVEQYALTCKKIDRPRIKKKNWWVVFMAYYIDQIWRPFNTKSDVLLVMDIDFLSQRRPLYRVKIVQLTQI